MPSSLLFWSLVSLATRAFSIPTVYISGSKFFLRDAAQTQFFIKGVVYQPGGSSKMVDPLANKPQCDLDIALMKDLGVNTISVYTVDATLPHDGCMNAFADAGIYVLVGLASPTYSVNRANPTWTTDMYEKYSAVLDAFAQYDNILGFYSGSEIINSLDSISSAPVIKAMIQDLKNYMYNRRHRQIPIGYGAADMVETRHLTADYLACGGSNATVDFVSFNNYGWCGDSSLKLSGFDTLLKEMDTHLLPVFFGETGCKPDASQRTFSDQAAILGPQMNGRFSGAIIYEWTYEVNKYGLVDYSSTVKIGSSSVSTPFPTSSDFSNLKKQWATLNPNGQETTWTPSFDSRAAKAKSCPSSTAGSSAWSINPTAALPTLGVKVFAGRAVVTASRTNLPTLSGTGSQTVKNGASGAGTGVGASASSESFSQGKPVDDQSGGEGGGGGGASTKKSGKTIGIIVGVAIVAFALLAFMIWFLVRRRRQKKRLLIMNPNEPAGLEVSGVDTFQPKPELDSFSAGIIGIRNRARKEKGVVELEGREKVDVVEIGGGGAGEKDVQEREKVVELPNEGSPTEAGAGGIIGKKPVAEKLASREKAISSANTPWMDEGREEFSQSSHHLQQPLSSPAATQSQYLAQAQAQTSDRAEIERLEEEERRLDREIVESERLANLKFERERVRRLLEEKRSGGGG